MIPPSIGPPAAKPSMAMRAARRANITPASHQKNMAVSELVKLIVFRISDLMLSLMCCHADESSYLSGTETLAGSTLSKKALFSPRL
jgi:hypothetical protein